jgi:hypothetical protein
MPGRAVPPSPCWRVEYQLDHMHGPRWWRMIVNAPTYREAVKRPKAIYGEKVIDIRSVEWLHGPEYHVEGLAVDSAP